MSSIDSLVLTRLLAVTVGYYSPGWPSWDEDRAREIFGDEILEWGMETCRTWHDDFMALEHWKIVPEITDAASAASSDFLREHPDLPPGVVKILEWAYVYGYR